MNIIYTNSHANDSGLKLFYLNPYVDSFIPHSHVTIKPITLLNPCTEMFIPICSHKSLFLNSYANIFCPGQIKPSNRVGSLLNPCAKTFFLRFSLLNNNLNYELNVSVSKCEIFDKVVCSAGSGESLTSICASTLSDDVNILRSSTQDTLCENYYITKG